MVVQRPLYIANETMFSLKEKQLALKIYFKNSHGSTATIIYGQSHWNANEKMFSYSIALAFANIPLVFSFGFCRIPIDFIPPHIEKKKKKKNVCNTAINVGPVCGPGSI